MPTDPLYAKVRDLAAGQFYDGVELIQNLGYQITKVRKDGLVITVENGRRFNITIVECDPDHEVAKL